MKMQDVCHSSIQPCPNFPEWIDGVFHSLTSGDLFTCAIIETHNVNCWGPDAKSILMGFSGVNMRSVTAGGSCMCGLNMTGHIICSEQQFGMLPGEAFEYTSLAIGSSHTCVIRQKNGTVISLGQYGSYFPVGSSRFEFLVGLNIDGLKVMCWGLNERNLSAVTLTLPQILPGVCIPDETFCTCGFYKDSGHLCGGSGIICKRSDSCTIESFKPPQPLPLTTSERPSIWLVFAGVFWVAVVGLLSYLMPWRLIPVETHLVEQDEPIPSELDLEAFSLKDLKDATNNFSLFTMVGEGGFGKVYKGKLPDGRLVAVKRSQIKKVSKRDYVFHTELKTQAKAHHGNVVNLIGYCIDENQRILIFEYMVEGNLYHHLHPLICLWYGKSQLFLSWRLRLTVLLDTARGINYLHQEANPRVIHKDIKSANILIDENWVAKISNFGGALTIPAPRTHIEVAIDQLVGTEGYCRPQEIKPGQTHVQINRSTDVYSFGVVIFEILTGQKGHDLSKKDLLRKAKCEEIIDKRLAKPVGNQMIALQRAMQLAKYCLKAKDDESKMSTVVSGLQEALTLFDN